MAAARQVCAGHAPRYEKKQEARSPRAPHFAPPREWSSSSAELCASSPGRPEASAGPSRRTWPAWWSPSRCSSWSPAPETSCGLSRRSWPRRTWTFAARWRICPWRERWRTSSGRPKKLSRPTHDTSFSSITPAFPKRSGLRRCVVNISSLCAVKPFPSWVLYCTGKAAREMMFKVLAEEEPDLRVLNYAPGPLDTDMQLVARTKTGELSLRKTYSDMFDEGQLLTCEASCAKLMKILLEDKYASGDHVDFYDV
ncbi:sepiapterin reductase a isoform X2 [Phyllopteryx taeniolatus]|uniref:sepiapterin reductase a isoform X2 n=1 Tax=Phyllopteryx taeniolatus TaxID=161469 RepID=UPI002AD23A5E|nr:sepiapterin reductase a isoform X2 [Phyllopteryx taeniolatus]